MEAFVLEINCVVVKSMVWMEPQMLSTRAAHSQRPREFCGASLLISSSTEVKDLKKQFRVSEKTHIE